MAGFAGYSGHQPLQVQLISIGGAGAMTGEAIARFVRADPSARSHFERCRYVARIADGDIETLNVSVEAETTLVERAVVAENVGLTGFPLTKRIEYRLGDCVNAVGYVVQALFTAAHNLVGVWAATEGQARMRAQNFAGGCRLERSPHRRQVLAGGFFGVAFCAGLGPGVPNVFFTRTPWRGAAHLAATHAWPLSVVKASIEAKQQADCDDEDQDGRGFYSAANL